MSQRHHYIWPAREINGPRIEFEWHPGKRVHCGVCTTDRNGNAPPHPLALRKNMKLRQRYGRKLDVG